jgi:predicted Rossmann fold flavoprotein
VESAKLFPVSNRARDVRDGLLRLARDRGVTFIPEAIIQRFSPASQGWRVERTGAPALLVDRVIVATGGLSVPKTGSDGLGLTVLGELGHVVHPVYPALTPILADPAPFAALAGVSLTVTITARSPERSATATGGFLFTHHGYSGPVVLDVSHVVARSRAARLLVQWTTLGEPEWEAALKPTGSGAVLGALRRELPDRLAAALLPSAGLDPTRPLAQIRRDERRRHIDALVRFELPWTGDDGYKKAEVTGGGVSLAEIDPRTMESRRHPGLFICGEALDAFGPIGGYNFLWAWATGRAAGLGAMRSL